MEEKLKSHNTKEWKKKMEKDKIQCGPIFNIKDAVENPKFQTIQLIINQNVSISGYIRFGCHGNYNQYPI